MKYMMTSDDPPIGFTTRCKCGAGSNGTGRLALRFDTRAMLHSGKLLRSVATILSLLAFLSSAERTQAQNCVDLAIVLAVDGSGSINTDEFHLQRQAIVAALRDPAVQQAMDRTGSVAAAVLYWGDPEWPVQDTPFVYIESQEDIELLVTAIETMPRRVLGDTGLSMGIAAALDKLETVRCAYRSVIDVSGDGSDTIVPRRKRLAPTLTEVRTRAAAAGVTINALVITSEEKDLKSYFENQVITGSKAFVMEIGSFSDYAEALRRKLVREITPIALTRY